MSGDSVGGASWKGSERSQGNRGIAPGPDSRAGNPGGSPIGGTDPKPIPDSQAERLFRAFWQHLHGERRTPALPPAPFPGSPIPPAEYARTWIELLAGFSADTEADADSGLVRGLAERAMRTLVDPGKPDRASAGPDVEHLMQLISSMQADLRQALGASGSLAEYNRRRILSGGWVLLPLSARLAGATRQGMLRLHVTETAEVPELDRVVVSLYPPEDDPAGSRHYLFRPSEPDEVLVRGAGDDEIRRLNESESGVRFRSVAQSIARFDGFSDYGPIDTLGLIDLWG